MPTARELMTPDATIVDVDTPIQRVAQLLGDRDIGAVVVCNTERRLQGVITDRDIAIEVVAAGKDVAGTTASDIVTGRETVTIGADDDLDEAVRTMTDHAVRRLPVIDGHDVIGVLSQADIARGAPADTVANLVRSISDAADNTGRG